MGIYLKTAKVRPVEDLTQVRDTVREVLDRVRREGLEAVRGYSAKFDNWSPASFRIGADEIRRVKSRLPATMAEGTDFCQAQIRNFAAEPVMHWFNPPELVPLGDHRRRGNRPGRPPISSSTWP
jgi:histidinol dehydrogenase